MNLMIEHKKRNTLSSRRKCQLSAKSNELTLDDVFRVFSVTYRLLQMLEVLLRLIFFEKPIMYV